MSAVTVSAVRALPAGAGAVALPYAVVGPTSKKYVVSRPCALTFPLTRTIVCATDTGLPVVTVGLPRAAYATPGSASASAASAAASPGQTGLRCRCMPFSSRRAISAASTRRFGERRAAGHPYRRSYTVQRMVQPSASYSITMRVRLPQQPGTFGRVASTIGETGGILGAIDLVRVES